MLGGDVAVHIHLLERLDRPVFELFRHASYIWKETGLLSRMLGMTLHPPLSVENGCVGPPVFLQTQGGTISGTVRGNTVPRADQIIREQP